MMNGSRIARGARNWALPVLALTFLLAGISSAPDSVQAEHLCGLTGSPAGQYDFETYEAADYRYAYGRSLELAGFNQLLPEHGAFALPGLETGDRAAGSAQTVAPYIPPVILKAIAWIESGWAQASYEPLVQYGEVGPTLVSHDCGYGIMQITSGMQNLNDLPNLDQVMIGGHYAFNIARGAHILADKWNLAPEYRPIVGNRDPNIIENWYYALWGYNGFVWGNHPLHPNYNPSRGLYDCASDRSGYPYQELVLGCVANPPWRGGVRLWDPVEVHLPDLNSPSLSTANWEACAWYFECAAMDMPTPSPYHADPAAPGVTRGQVLGAPTLQVSQDQITLPYPGAEVQVTVSNPGSGLMTYGARTTALWLKVSRVEGVALGADLGARNSAFVVSADGAMAPGNYNAQVVLESLYPAGTSRVMQVNMSIECTPSGTIDAADALQILRNVAGLPACLADVGDANCSGQVDAVDALVVLRYVAALPTGVPPGCPPLS